MSSASGTGDAIFRLKLDDEEIEEKRAITNGRSGSLPYTHPSGKIIFTEPCGLAVNRIKLFKENNLISKPLTPCTSDIKRETIYSPKIYLGKLSPDETKIAVWVFYGSRGYLDDEASVIIYDQATGEELKRYVDFGNPEWHPDGRLLISPAGSHAQDFCIFITDENFTALTRIDQEQINVGISFPDISPSGKQVIFTMGQQIWIMDIDGDNLKELIAEDSNLLYPTWSPHEEYIAYFRYGSYSAEDKLMFYKLSSQEKYELNTNTVLPSDNGSYMFISPVGPLSWIE